MPHTPEVKAIHPLGKIPVMRDGDVELCESRAIITYLDLKFPGLRLTSSDPLIAAKTEQFIAMFCPTLQPLLGPGYIAAYFFSGNADGSPDRARIDANMAKVTEYLALLEGMVKSGHLVGNDFTLADAYLIPVLYYLKNLPESGAIIGKSVPLSAYIERHDARASVKATVPPPLPGR
jgi:glutathione S-transferase